MGSGPTTVELCVYLNSMMWANCTQYWLSLFCGLCWEELITWCVFIEVLRKSCKHKQVSLPSTAGSGNEAEELRVSRNFTPLLNWAHPKPGPVHNGGGREVTRPEGHCGALKIRARGAQCSHGAQRRGLHTMEMGNLGRVSRKAHASHALGSLPGC